MLHTLPFRLAISLLILLVLAACGSTDPRMPAPRCRAAGAEAELGKMADEKVVHLHDHPHAARCRWLLFPQSRPVTGPTTS